MLPYAGKKLQLCTEDFGKALHPRLGGRRGKTGPCCNAHLLELHNVRVHEASVILNLPLNILRDLHIIVAALFRALRTTV